MKDHGLQTRVVFVTHGTQDIFPCYLLHGTQKEKGATLLHIWTIFSAAGQVTTRTSLIALFALSVMLAYNF